MRTIVAAAATARSEVSAAAARVGKARPVRRNTKQGVVINLEEHEKEGSEDEDEEEEGKDDYVSGDGDASIDAGVGEGSRGRRHHEQAEGEGSKQRRRQRKASFIESNALADLKVARRTVIAGWKSALTRAIGLKQAKQEHRLKKQGRRHPT